jgi:signal transduction histidine kinase
LRDGKFTVVRKIGGLPSDTISALCVDNEGVLWIGTAGGGLARFFKNKWTTYTTAEGLSANSISYLIQDNEGYLWVGSNMGLMRIARNALNDYADGKAASVWCRVYLKPDGLPTHECTQGSQPAACRSSDGRLWFATIRGLVSVNPASLKPNGDKPPVVIESVTVQGREQMTNALIPDSLRAVIVPPGKELLEIRYTSLNLAAADRARFRYKLEGLETGWTDARERRLAPFSNLRPGRYVFHVIACNEDGVWNEAGARLAVIVLPPFWRTTWFITVNALALLALVIFVVRYISTQKLQRQLALLRQHEAVEKERARIARDLHDQLGANLTQVALLGEMAESDKNLPDEVESHARQISQTARETTQALDEIVWAANPSNDTLEGLVTYSLKYAQEYLELAGVSHRLEVPAQLPDAGVAPEVRHNVFLAFKEAVNNVVKHAQATSVRIRLRLEPDRFTLEIEDNGRGLANPEGKPGRNGLRNMRKRLDDVGGSFEIGPAAGQGTLVRLTAPIEKH